MVVLPATTTQQMSPASAPAGSPFVPVDCVALPGTLVESLLSRDDYMLLADYASYIDSQEKVDSLYCQPSQWARTSILNTASMGKFSSDRTIAEYAREIWNLAPVPPPDDAVR